MQESSGEVAHDKIGAFLCGHIAIGMRRDKILSPYFDHALIRIEGHVAAGQISQALGIIIAALLMGRMIRWREDFTNKTGFIRL